MENFHYFSRNFIKCYTMNILDKKQSNLENFQFFSQKIVWVTLCDTTIMLDKKINYIWILSFVSINFFECGTIWHYDYVGWKIIKVLNFSFFSMNLNMLTLATIVAKMIWCYIQVLYKISLSLFLKKKSKSPMFDKT